MEYPTIEEWPFIVADCETTGLEWWRHKAFAVALTLPNGRSYCFDLRDENQASWCRDNLPRARRLVNHNLKFDLHFLREAGIRFTCPLYCTMVAAALIDEHLLSYSLDNLGLQFCGKGKDVGIYAELAAMFGGAATAKGQAPHFHEAPWSLLSKYAIQDTETTLALYTWEIRQVEEQDLSAVVDLEMRLLPVLVEMEQYGVRVDLPAAERAMVEITNLMLVKQEKLDRLAGFPINPNPSKSIHTLFQPQYDEKTKLWTLRDGTVCETTDAGKPSIDAECLQRMSDPAAKLILDLRKKAKTRDTFLAGHVLGSHHNGIIHANFNQTKGDNELGTGTGRLSCNAPALQQIPKRDHEIAAIVRSVFLPDLGQDWACRDWSQMDFRVFAHYAANPKILQMYRDNPEMDFHQMVADMTGLPRKAGDKPEVKGNAKQINLGLVFGMGEGKLAHEMGLPYTLSIGRAGKEYFEPGEEAREVFAQYHENVPGIKALLSRASSIAKTRGYVRTVLGRRIRFPHGQFTHKAGGLIFQGSAADALKQKIVEVHEVLHGSGSRLILNVHDELDMSMERGSDELTKRIGEIYECFDGVNCPIKFDVPIRSSCGIGPNWWEASK